MTILWVFQLRGLSKCTSASLCNNWLEEIPYPLHHIFLSRQKFPEDGLHKLFPGGSGDLSSENFAAGWFLLERHHATPFDDLRAGLAFLRRKVDGQKEGQLSFIKVK